MILAVGLTPAYQQILQFSRVSLGQVNRAESVHWCASGKVLNVGKAVCSLGGRGKVLTLVGGPYRGMIQDEFRSLNIPAQWIESATATRVCTTILDSHSGRTTELVENANSISEAECAALCQAFAEEAENAECVILTGSLPAGMSPDLFARLLTRFRKLSILDIRGPALEAALVHRPFLVKPNREELEQTSGKEFSSPADLLCAMRELNARGARWVVVSEGADPTYVTGPEGAYRFTPANINAVNPIGCGDCLAGGIAYAMTDGSDVLDSIRFGMAAAADNATRIEPALLNRELITELIHQIKVEPA